MGVDFKDWDKLKKNFEATNQSPDLFLESCGKELAQMFLSSVVKLTPVGVYPGNTGKTGGTLRRGWTSPKSLSSSYFGGTYLINITNPVEYASYVEYGHRTKNHKGWVEGKHMATKSEARVKETAPAFLNHKIKKELEKRFK